MSERETSRNPASFLLLASLTLLAILGNLFHVNLFFGADFIFGSVAVFLVIHYFGTASGSICAALAGVYTYWLWGHPYNILIYTLEAAFVGLLLKPGRKNILLFDGIFWLFLGMPLVWLFHHVIMGVGLLETLFVALVQSVNGMFNALVANLLITALFFRQFREQPGDDSRKPFHEMLFNLIVAAVILPALTVTVLNSRQEERQVENETMARLEEASREFITYLTNWKDLHFHAMEGMAKGAALSGMVSSVELEQYIELITSAYPDIQHVNLADASGAVFSVFPPVGERGVPSIGPDFTELIQREKLLGTKGPATFESFIGKEDRSLPFVMFSVPVLAEEHLQGYALAAVNLSQVHDFLRVRENRVPEITLVNMQNHVIVSSSPTRKPRTVFNPLKTGATERVSETVIRWMPREEPVPAVKGWRNSTFIQESPVSAMIPWKVVAEIHLAPKLSHLFTRYVQNLASIFILCALALPLAYFLSRRVVQPLEKLAEMTTNLPERLLEQESIDWPESGNVEIHSLVANFQIMALALERQFQELKEGSTELEEINEELQTRIGESKRAEEALRESEERYREMSDLLPQPVYEMDLEGRFTFVNHAALEAFGYSKEEALGGLTAVQVFARDDLEMEPADILQYLNGEKAGRNEYAILRKDGGTFPAIVYSSTVSRGGRVVGLRGIVVDLTDQKKAETELITRQKLESLGVLAGGLAHDYNNILTGILGNISLAKMFALPGDRVMKRLDQLELAALKAKNLTQQLLTFARGGTPIKRTTSIARLLESSVHFALLGSNVRCELEIDSDLWASEVDEGQITQVIHNIVLNAVQAMPEGGVVTVRAANEVLHP
ncbi:MAG: PAS domain S-box protein, partial [Syntrophobacteraceae bacterium]|nr:PAS domain S-box protein [Syntrophobacteraceae bacterium]